MNYEQSSKPAEECSPNERANNLEVGSPPRQKKQRRMDETSSNKISDGFNSKASEYSNPLQSIEKDKKVQCEARENFQSQYASLNNDGHQNNLNLKDSYFESFLLASAYHRSIVDKLTNRGTVNVESSDERGLSLKTQTRPDQHFQNDDMDVNNNSMRNFISASVTANMAHHLHMIVNSASASTGISDTDSQMPESQTGWQPFLPATSGNIHLSKHNTSCHYTSDNALNRGPLLYFPTDDEFLSEQQIFIRKQIEFFESALGDVGKTTSGRKHPTRLNQVGIQCRHCASLPLRYRERGAVFFPAKLIGIYQASQNIAAFHMIQLCQLIDNDTKEKLKGYKQCRSVSGHGGKKYWAETAKAQGIIDSESGCGLRFQTKTTIGNNSLV